MYDLPKAVALVNKAVRDQIRGGGGAALVPPLDEQIRRTHGMLTVDSIWQSW
jgi:hypothetical protein